LGDHSEHRDNKVSHFAARGDMRVKNGDEGAPLLAFMNEPLASASLRG
jgi:hypothetical protein